MLSRNMPKSQKHAGDKESLFVPRTHVATPAQRATIWKASAGQTECWEPYFDGLVADVEVHLSFELRGPLHVVVYSSNEEACSNLGRAVPGNMLLAPVLSAQASVIAVQSVAVDSGNGDLPRMKRHLCHELTHVLVAHRTRSEKRLGDGGVNMHVASWVNEGFAECVSATVCGQPQQLARALGRASGMRAVGDLDAALDDLLSARRSAAFAVATARVWKSIQVHGVRYVFDNLSEPSSWSVEMEMLTP
jgi:hypothetical protein